MELNIYLPSKQPLTWADDKAGRCRRRATHQRIGVWARRRADGR